MHQVPVASREQFGWRVRCEGVTLYQGGVSDLYKYKRYQDVRLVFALEETASFPPAGCEP